MKIRFLNYPIFLVILLVCLLAASCHDDPETPTPSEGRTVLVYQVANNNLNGYSYDDFKEMMDGASRGLGKGNRLIVYRHTRYEGPSLVEITAKDTVTLKHYDKSLSSVDINRMTEVINDVKRLANTPQYGLVLWSHASGWIEDGIEQSPVKRSFGDDNYKRMNNRDLARALKASGGFDWIYFDCCYMMSVESLYELRGCARRFAGSVTELQTPGMPYHLNLKYFFAPGEADLTGAARSTFEYYEKLIAETPDDVINNYCTMSVVKASALDEVARTTKEIYSKTGTSLPEGFSAQMYSSGVREESCNYFDFAHYVEALTHDKDGAERYEGAGADLESFRNAMADAVLYDAATPFLRRVPIDNHCGMSTFILRTPQSCTKNKYNELSWYRDVASLLKF